MNFSIYELDEDIKKLLNVDNFLNGLSVNDFIEEISKDHFLKGTTVNEFDSLDPKPYIRTFEGVQRELNQLVISADKQKQESEKLVDEYELIHSENVLELNQQFKRATQKFDTLDNQISTVSSKINPLGKVLNKITNSRDRSQETIFLIRAYHGFHTRGSYEELELLRTSKKKEDRIKCAKTVSNLITLARKIGDEQQPKTIKCTSTIEEYGQNMEDQLLKTFEIASEDGDFSTMKDVAQILFAYNKGINVIQTFIEKNEISEQIQDNSNSLVKDEAIWTRLSDPNCGDHDIKDEIIESTLQNLRMEIKSRAWIIRQVFDDQIPVLKIFIQRIYSHIIRNNVTNLLQYSLSVSTLAHVRVLHSLSFKVGDFTKDVKEFLITNEFERDNELSNVLDQSLNDLFIEYTADEIYFIREKKNLEETIYEIVHKFNTVHETIISNAALATKLENIENGEFNEKPQPESDKLNFHFSERKRMNQFKAYVKAKLATARSSELTDQRVSQQDLEEYSKLNVGKMEIVLKSTIESIARILELTPNKTPQYSLEILEILIIDFGKLYIGSGLEVIYDEMHQEVSKTQSIQPFDLKYLKSFNVISENLFLLSSCIKKIILPCATNMPNIKNRMSNLLNNYISQCEKSLNIILQETLEMFSNRISFLLTKQKRRDFYCDKIEDVTEACEVISDFLIDIQTILKSTMNNENLERTFVKTGMDLLHQLLEHYKKFPVNSIGGVVLTQDVSRYQSIVTGWGITELSQEFTILKEIGNLFTVSSELVNSLIMEGRLAKMKPYTVRQYISKRADFNPGYTERLLKLTNI